MAVLTPSNRIAQADRQTWVSTGADLSQKEQARPKGWRGAQNIRSPLTSGANSSFGIGDPDVRTKAIES